MQKAVLIRDPARCRHGMEPERQEMMASSNIVEFTTENWEKEVEQSDKPVLVDFWAPWCGPCRMLGPTIDKIADQFAGKVKVGKLNVDDAPDVATKFGVTSIPRVFIFKGSSKPQKTFVGVTSENELVKTINSLL
jgi:thioredoxin 1